MNPEKIDRLLLEEMEARTRDLERGDDEGAAKEDDGRQYPVIVGFEAMRGGLEVAAMGIGAEPELTVERTLRDFNGVAGRATTAQIEALSTSPGVRKIWYDEPVYAMLDSSLKAIGIPPLFNANHRGAGVRLAVLDTGVDAAHPDFNGRLLTAHDLTDEQRTADGNGHGTHVASIALGSGEASGGRFRGVAPEALLLSGKVLRSDGTGRMSMVIAGIEWAVDQGAQIINLSLGTRGASDGNDPTSQMVNRAVEAGVVVIAAAGNEGPAAGTIGSPGAAARAITVGAVSDEGKIADFSSRGPTLDGRAKPDLVLTGVAITAARAAATTLGQPVDERYTTMRGTSMATPHVAGIVALMLGANPALTPASVSAILTASCRSIGLDATTAGKGILEPQRAVAKAVEGVAPPAPTPPPATPPSPPAQTPPAQTPPAQTQPAPTPAPPAERPGCLGSLGALFKR